MPYDEYFLVNYWLPIVGFLITLVAQIYVKSSYSRYKREVVSKRISGAETARLILDKNGLNDIDVIETRGELTDHYDPGKKIIRLSRDIYEGRSIASLSVAAHECGHAIQDKDGYLFFKLRSFLVPIANFSTKIGYFVVIIGIIFNVLKLAIIGLILLLGMLLFQLVTLPVEFNASRRAEKQLKEMNLLDEDETKGSKRMLRAAAYTYVASLVTTLLQVLRLALIVFGRDRD